MRHPFKTRLGYKNIPSLSLCSLLFVNVMATPVMAADAATGVKTPKRSSLMEEVVVSARKKAAGESVQDTPIAMSAFGSDQFEAVFADDVGDLGFLMPNVELKQAGQVGVQNFTVRGMGVSGTTPSDSPAVGIFQNGVFWGTNYGGLLDTFDIESIEVLRGPQGTLFGRNVTAGAVVIKTKRPTNEFGFDAEIVAGNYGRKDFSVAVEGALIDDKLAGRLVVLDRSLDGYYNNVFTGNDFGESDTTLVRGTLVFTPSEELDLTVILEDYAEDGSSQAAVGIEVPGNLPYTQVGFRQPSNWWDIRLDNPGRAKNDIQSATFEFNYKLDSGVITGVTGYRDVEIDHNTDFDGSEFSGFNRSIYMEQDQLSQELRFASSFSQTFEYTVGLYYYQAEQDYREGRDINNHSVVFAAGSHLDQRSWAAFGEMDFDLTTDLTLTVGGRYTQEDIEAQAVAWGTCPLDTNIANPQRIRDLSLPCDLGDKKDADWSDFSPKLGVNYQLNEQQMAYASATRGFRSGGYSMRGIDISNVPAFDAEQVTAYEVGYKGDLLDEKLRLNAAVYYNKYDDLQRTILVPTTDGSGVAQSTGNAAKATIQGLELDVVFQLTDALVLTAAYGYTDASFDSYQGFDVNGGGYDPVVDAALAKDLDFTRVPKETYSASATYEFVLDDLGSLALRLAASKTGSMYFDDVNAILEPSYTLWDASATFTDSSEHWTLALFGKNLTEEEYSFWGSSLGALGQNRFVGPPRTVGLKVAYHY